MKKYILSIIVITALMLEGCLNLTFVTFDKPQPEQVKSLNVFPKRLHGKYLNSDSSSVATITDKLMIENWEIEYKEHKDSLDFIYTLIDDTLIDLQRGKVKNIFLQGDTIVYHKDEMDTLFNISSTNILKKFKGYYFLNYLFSNKDNAWYVRKFDFRKDTLIISDISGDEIKMLEAITGTTADMDSLKFNLTRRQFKRFIKKGGFTEQNKFIRKKEKDQY